MIASALLAVSGFAFGFAGNAPPPAANAAPQPTIEEIRFEGNRRTRPSTMLREMLVKPGDTVDWDRIERSRQAIMDLRLFKSVEARLDPGSNGELLILTVREKRYAFVLPVLNRNGDGDLTYGAQAKLDNLRGRNHQLEAGVERRDFASGADIDDEERLELVYRHPRILDGPWELDANLRYRAAFLEEDRDGVRGDYDRVTRSVGLLVARWKKPTGPSRGWRFGAGLLYEDFEFELMKGEPGLFFDTTEVGALGQVVFRNIRFHEFSRSGREFRYSLVLFPEVLGSSKDRLIHSSLYRAYRPITGRHHTNLNFQFRWSLTTESLFGDPTFGLGGSSGLRGYDRHAIEGDAFILANLEFLTPIFNKNALRAVVFLDVGDAFRDRGHFTLSDLKSGGGVGLRWRLRTFVDVDLRADLARGFDDDAGGETKVYAGANATY
jgi:outer membrane protein assembly factor BamA